MRELVLISGWGMPATVLAPLQEALRKAYNVTVLPAPSGATLAAMAQAALAVAPPRAAWFGWSLGGMVAVQAAALQPSRVASLVTLATNLSFIARPDWPHAMPVADFAAFSALFDRDPASALARFAALQCSGSSSARDDLRRLRAGCSDPAGADALRDTAALRDGLDVLHDSDLRSVAATLACPSLWLHGEYDALVPAAVSDDVARRVPGARTRMLPGASHVSALQDPAVMVDALSHFIVEYA